MVNAPGKDTSQKHEDGTDYHLPPEFRGAKLFSHACRARVLGRQVTIGSKGKCVDGG